MRGASAKSAVRAFALLELCRELRRPLRLKDFVDRLGFPTSSTAELLKAMAEAGYLSFDSTSRTYFPTPRLASLGDWIGDALFEEQTLLDAMHDLHEQTGEAILLATANGLHVQYIDGIQCEQPIRFVVEIGTRRPMVCSGPGTAILCRESDEFIEKIYRRTKAKGLLGEHGPSFAELQRRIRTARDRGYFFAKDIVYKGACSIAAAVSRGRQGRKLAISIAGPTGRIQAREKEFAEALRRTTTAF